MNLQESFDVRQISGSTRRIINHGLDLQTDEIFHENYFDANGPTDEFFDHGSLEHSPGGMPESMQKIDFPPETQVRDILGNINAMVLAGIAQSIHDGMDVGHVFLGHQKIKVDRGSGHTPKTQGKAANESIADILFLKGGEHFFKDRWKIHV